MDKARLNAAVQADCTPPLLVRRNQFHIRDPGRALGPAELTWKQARAALSRTSQAIIASAFPSRSATADCSSYFLTTVTPATYTTTLIIATITSVVDMKKRDEGILYPRQETVAPTNIPAYASACSGSVRYSSACSCVGVTAMTTMAPTLTYTQTVTTTTYLISAPTLLINKYPPRIPLSDICLTTAVPTNLTLDAYQLYRLREAWPPEAWLGSGVNASGILSNVKD
ncbi:hypothetical protein L207DRAFT_522397 [Hyaloscypha variabilis F]|uniref:Uncharacterized protein n=1 Tax=Hyaloscypha variabilis (strain UAMH 11265 / GT02V1 / F) TaxID=1149755 RepID=A0A2J6SEA2_HYAVF|nr:hypothetical protein L207DRAFT_522397 [Hyaloscypha variabilis F]